MEHIPALDEDDVADGYVGFSTDTMPDAPHWSIRRLWQLAADLTVVQRPLTKLSHCLEIKPGWCAGDVPTVREFAHHAQRILSANLSYPIIFSAEGFLLEGKHRLAKAWLLKQPTIATVQFQQDPEPDFREPK